MNRSRIFPSLMIAGTSGYVKFAAAGGGMAALLHVGRSSSSSPAQAKLRAPLGRADPARSADYCPPRLRCDGMRPLWGISFAGQNHSRRWRQVGGPRRVSPTVLKAAKRGGRLFFSSLTAQPRLRAPRHIRQSRSCHRREQSFAHSGVRHALLPPAGDVSSAPCGAELFFFSSSCTGRAPRHTR